MDRPASSAPLLEEDFFVDVWLVQPRRNQISKGATVLELEPKVMRVLACLAYQAGAVLSREELMQAVWPGLVVGEKSLAGAISKLRKAFEDDPYHPRVIKTVSKRGYMLIAPVTRPATPVARAYSGDNVPEVVLSLPPATPAASSKRVRSKRGTVIALGLVLVLVGGGLLWGMQVMTRSTPPRAQATLLTSYPGHEINPALAPDGDTVVFAWTGTEGDNWDLYIQQPGTETPLRRTEDPAYDLQPAWSPDGSQIAFMRFTEEDCGLYVMAALAGPARPVGPCAGRIWPGSSVFFKPNLSWSPDGQSLVFSYRESIQDPLGLYQLSLETLERRRLTSPPDGFWGDYDASWAPDGQRIAFTRRQGGGSADLYVYALASETVERLTYDYRSLLGHDWTPDSQHLVFSSERDGTYNLWRIPTTGGEPEWVPAVGWNVKAPSLAREGAAGMVYENWFYDNNIWRLSLRGAATDTPPEAQRFIASTLREIHPQYSPDGAHVAFVSNRSGSYEVWMADSTGANPLQLTTMEGPIVGVPQWSPDGLHLVFEARPEGQADVYVIDRQSRHVRRLTTDEADDVLPGWTPDGAWIHFSSRREGAWHLWKVPAQGGRAEQIGQHEGFAAQVSSDGLSIYYTKRGKSGLWRRSIGGGAEQPVLGELHHGDWGNWVLSPEGVYFIDRTRPRHLGYYRFATQQVEHLVPLVQAPGMSQPGLTVSPDGRWLLYTQLDQTESDLMFIERMP